MMHRFADQRIGGHIAVLLCCSVCATTPSMAQIMTCAATSGPGVGCTAGPQLAGFGDVVKGQPYVAQASTETQQTMADGTHITQTTTTSSARDSEGRTFQRMTLGDSGASGSEVKTTFTSIFDPTTKTHIDYTSDEKVAHEFTMNASDAPQLPDAPSGKPQFEAGFTVRAGDAAGSGANGGPVLRMFAPADSPQMHPTKESLGTRTIDGLEAIGTRTTTTIPAGTMGNDKDIVTTEETWYSPDLKLTLQSKQTDPRFGETTYSLTDLDRSEPDPSLFQVPAGYTIDKAPAQVHSRRVN